MIYHINIARPIDAAAMATLQANPYTANWIAADFRGWLSKDNLVALKAEIDGRLVGYLMITCSPPQADILDFAIAPSCRRQGIGTALLEQGMQQLIMLNINKLWGEVAVANKAAWQLYKLFGAQAAGLRRGYYHLAGEKQDAQRFCISLIKNN